MKYPEMSFTDGNGRTITLINPFVTNWDLAMEFNHCTDKKTTVEIRLTVSVDKVVYDVVEQIAGHGVKALEEKKRS